MIAIIRTIIWLCCFGFAHSAFLVHGQLPSQVSAQSNTKTQGAETDATSSERTDLFISGIYPHLNSRCHPPIEDAAEIRDRPLNRPQLPAEFGATEFNAESVLVSDVRASSVTLNNNGSEVAIDVSVLEYFGVLFAGKDANVVRLN